MTSQRIFALLLICIQAAMLGYVSNAILLPAALVAVALFGFVARTEYRVTRDQAFWLYIILVIALALKDLIAPQKYAMGTTFLQTPMAHLVAAYFLIIQVSQFFVRHKTGRLPLLFPIFGIAVMVFAGDINLQPQQRLVTQSLAVLFVAVSGFYLNASHDRVPTGYSDGSLGRASLSTLLMVITGGLAWFSASGLFRYERQLEVLIGQFLYANETARAVGFSNHARLGNLARQKQTGEDQIALRVFSRRPAGYLRGKVYEIYYSSGWESVGESKLLPYSVARPPGFPEQEQGYDLFAIRNRVFDNGQVLEVWTEIDHGGYLFAPMGTSHIEAAVEEMTADANRILHSDELPIGPPYHLFATSEFNAEALDEEHRRFLVSIPEDIDPRVQTLANRVFRGCKTTEEKLTAVKRYFANNYTYTLGISIPADVDPISYFLLNQPAAHCEYFASGTTVLLRLAGVPCRYVTGFVASERNSLGGFWIARNKDAHAWVEAYDEQRGWVTVETTPAEGIPHAVETSQLSQFWEHTRNRFHMFRVRFQQQGLTWIIANVISVLTSFPAIAVMVLLVVGRVFVVLKRARRNPKPKPPASTLQLRRLLNKMDAKLRKQKLRRKPGETLHQFADRIDSEPVAQWYRLFASVRYHSRHDDETIQQLRLQTTSL